MKQTIIEPATLEYFTFDGITYYKFPEPIKFDSHIVSYEELLQIVLERFCNFPKLSEEEVSKELKKKRETVA